MKWKLPINKDLDVVHYIFFHINKTKVGTRLKRFTPQTGTIGKTIQLHPDGFKERTMDSDINNVKTARRSKEQKKVLRKQLKASHTLLKHEGINTASQPTKVKYKQYVLAEK